MLFACKGNENREAELGSDTVPAVKIEYTCPMHPEIVSDTPTVCPRCGMELEIRS
jgi:hypothetical protein